MFTRSSDPLQEALNSKKATRSFYKLAESQNNFFKTSKFDFEYFGLSFTQRILAFVVSLALGSFLLITSFYRFIFYRVINLSSFVVPYLLSNMCFLFMFGFISGFKTFTINLFKPTKRIFSISFLATTTLTTYVSFVSKSSILIGLIGICHMVSFTLFIITFLPGGTAGAISLINMFLKR